MTDNLARLILLVGLLLFAPVGVYHRLRSRTDERLDRPQEGWLILLGLRLVALAFMVGLAAFLVDPGSMAWASLPLQNWARWSGAALGLADIGLIFWTFRRLLPASNRNAVLALAY